MVYNNIIVIKKVIQSITILNNVLYPTSYQEGGVEKCMRDK
jgi:hypothetical protein